MASVVIGVGTSHSPQLSTDVDVWPIHAERDRSRSDLRDVDGEVRSFEEISARRSATLAPELDEGVWQQKYERCQAGIDELSTRLAAAAPDVVVIVGDDQRELFLDDVNPVFAIFWGDVLHEIALTDRQIAELRPGMKEAMWAWHSETGEDYHVHSGLARHLIESTVAEQFDVAQFTRQPAGRGLGHAFVFVRRRLLGTARPAIIPIFVNTFFPPNQPSAARCYEFGRAVRRAIESWPEDLRVAIVGSGGLSHFVIDEDFDRDVLAALHTADPAAIGALGQDKLQSGTSEVRNWIVAAGACEGMDMTVHDYVPTHRSDAGTGVGMAFATWEHVP